MTDNRIRDGGAEAISEMLKTNTTLTSLTLNGNDNKQVSKDNITHGNEMTGNEIEINGTKAMSEMLKVNTTLTSLDLMCNEEEEPK